jgi:hypothetical protein
MKIVLIYVGAYYDYCALAKIHSNLDKCDDTRVADTVDVVRVLFLVVEVYRDNDHEVMRRDVDEMDVADEAEVGLLFLLVEAVESNDSRRPLSAALVGVVQGDEDDDEGNKVPCTEKP